MARQTADLEDEFEDELEDELEFESEFEDEWEDEYEDESEDFLPGLGGVVNAIGGLLGEEEYEDEDEYEDELEAEDELEEEAFLGLLGPIARAAGSLLGGGDGEHELEAEDEAEAFFKRLKGVFRKAAPFLKTLAKTAGPLVATAVGGPAAGAIARAVTSQLEGEGEEELEAEFEEMAAAPLSPTQASAEYLAAQAAATEAETEAEALAGGAAYAALRPEDRRDLERLLPHLLRGAATVTRMLHGNRNTRPAVRMIPGIVDGTARSLARRIATGEPVGPVELGQVMGSAVARALRPGPTRQAVMRRHARGLARMRRRSARGYGYGRGYRPSARRRWTGMPRGAVRTGVRRPVRSRTGGVGRARRPRPGFVRISTPVRVPPKAGRPGRVVRVVSDVRIPRGSVVAGRPSNISGRHGR